MVSPAPPHESSAPSSSLGWEPISWSDWTNERAPLALRSHRQLLSTLKLAPVSRWSVGALHLPHPQELKALWRSPAATLRAPDHVMVIGDSLSATDHYLRCFRERSPLRSHPLLAQLIYTLNAQREQGVLTRDSYAAQPGATSWRIIKPKPFSPTASYGRTRRSLKSAPAELLTPLLREIYESPARIATVLLGTNDARYHRGAERFSVHYLKIVTTLLDAGVLPLLFTLPPQHDRTRRAQIDVLNQIIKTMAAVHRLPLIDLASALSRLPRAGLRDDGIHLNAYRGGCVLSKKGLRYGHNMRNLMTLEALIELKRVLGDAPESASAPESESESESESAPAPAPESAPAPAPESAPDSFANSLANPPHLAPLKRAPLWVSEVSAQAQHINADDPCHAPLYRSADRAPRWRAFRPLGPYAHGAPRAVYGEWRRATHNISIARSRTLKVLVIGMLDHPSHLKPDASREQFWLRLKSGRCVALREVHQSVQVTRGEHQLYHYARFGELTPTLPVNKQQAFRAVFSWE